MSHQPKPLPWTVFMRGAARHLATLRADQTLLLVRGACRYLVTPTLDPQPRQATVSTRSLYRGSSLIRARLDLGETLGIAVYGQPRATLRRL